MARKVTAGHQALRQSEHNTDRSGKWDLRAHHPDGTVQHVCRYSSKEQAESAKERLSCPAREKRELLGLPEEYDLQVESAER